MNHHAKADTAAACLVAGIALAVLLDGWWQLIPFALAAAGLWLIRGLR